MVSFMHLKKSSTQNSHETEFQPVPEPLVNANNDMQKKPNGKDDNSPCAELLMCM